MISEMPVSEVLKKEFTTRITLKRYFPFWLNPGVVDYSETIHSLGLNYITAIGRESGYLAISEYPVCVPQDHRFAPLGEVRTDSVWLNRDNYSPVLLGEFERYDRGKKDKLRQKIENLVIGYHQFDGKVKDLVLVFWVKGNENPGDISPVISGIYNGFIRNGHTVPGISTSCKMHIFKCVLKTLDNLYYIIGDIIHVPI